MNWYPQLQSGATVQLPLHKQRNWRLIANQFENGEQLYSPDLSANQISWRLDYTGLTEAEVASLRSLFETSRGRFGSFGFVDPLVNLLAGSEDLSRPDWQMGMMTAQGGFGDPLRTQRAWRLSNPSAGNQDLQQTLSFPGSLNACFSAFVRSDTVKALGIRRDSVVVSKSIGPIWTRVQLSGVGDPGAATSTFAIRLGPGQSVDLWGFQAEAQPFASPYKPSVTAQGVYPETYFAVDQLSFISTAPGLSSCSVQAISRVR